MVQINKLSIEPLLDYDDTHKIQNIMKTLYLIRHGETEANKENIFRGRSNIPLSDNGITQSQELARYFEKLNIDFVYSSPMPWSIKTAEIIFDGKQIISENLLTNINMGRPGFDYRNKGVAFTVLSFFHCPDILVKY